MARRGYYATMRVLGVRGKECSIKGFFATTTIPCKSGISGYINLNLIFSNVILNPTHALPTGSHARNSLSIL
jgi:hypothetical protein